MFRDLTIGFVYIAPPPPPRSQTIPYSCRRENLSQVRDSESAAPICSMMARHTSQIPRITPRIKRSWVSTVKMNQRFCLRCPLKWPGDSQGWTQQLSQSATNALTGLVPPPLTTTTTKTPLQKNNTPSKRSVQ